MAHDTDHTATADTAGTRRFPAAGHGASPQGASPVAAAPEEALRRAEAAIAAGRAALAAGADRLRLALDAARMALWEWDFDGDRVTGSPGREALYGRPPGSLATRAAVLEAVHPEDRAAAAATILRAMTRPPGEEEFDAIEFRVTDPDGTVRWLRSQGRVTAREPGTGRALRAAGVTFDITLRKTAELAALEAEARHRTLFDAAPFVVIVIDSATHAILDVNERACAEYGYTREEFLRLTIADVDALGDSEAIRTRARARVVRPGVQEFEARHRMKSGEIRDVLVRVQGVRLGGRDVTYGAHFDITDRKAAEAALAESEARAHAALAELRAIYDGAPVGLCALDAELRILRANEALARMQGLPAAAALPGHGLREAAPGLAAAAEAALRQVLATGEPLLGLEVAVEALPGRPPAERRRVWRLGLLPLAREGGPDATHPDDGRVAGVNLVAEDVTERRAAEERQALLALEVDHRAKNALAVVSALLHLSPAEGDGARRYAEALRGRVAAMARAHDLLARGHWSGAGLRALVEEELAPYRTAAAPPSPTPGKGEGEAGGADSVSLDGPAVALSPEAARALAMVLHELATNAARHGALSAPGGRLEVVWRLEEAGDDGGGGDLRLTWTETGGPPLAGTPTRRGFGSRLVEATVRGQLGGRIALDWRADGLRCDVRVPRERLQAA